MEHFLPDLREVADQLEVIVDNLDHWKSMGLAALRSLPSVERYTGQPEQSERERSNTAIIARIEGALKEVVYDKNRRALGALLAFEDETLSLNQRYEAAANHLGVSPDAVRKGRAKALLFDLATELYRAELVWATLQLDALANQVPSSSSSPWYRATSLLYAVRIDDEDVRRQTWTLQYKLRAAAAAQPLFLVPQKWSGTQERPPSDDDIEVLTTSSGQRADIDDRFSHRLLRIRPESRSPYAYTLLMFDLGHPVAVGEDIDFAFRRRLVDDGGTFQPLITFLSAPHPALRSLRLRAYVPERVATMAQGIELMETEPIQPGLTGNASLQPTSVVDVRRGPDGYFTYEPDHIIVGRRYELWWGERDAWPNRGLL